MSAMVLPQNCSRMRASARSKRGRLAEGSSSPSCCCARTKRRPDERRKTPHHPEVDEDEPPVLSFTGDKQISGVRIGVEEPVAEDLLKVGSKEPLRNLGAID